MFSFSSSALVDQPFDWAYQLEDLGYSGWEIVNEGRQRLTAETIPLAREIVETTDLVITIHLPYSDLNLASMNQPIWEETLRQMKECISFASEFCGLAVVHPGYLSPLGKQMPDRAWEQNILGLQEICDHAAEFGMRIAVENMLKIESMLGRTPEEIQGILENVRRENLGFVFDVGHANTNGNVDSFLALKEKMIHVHVHDNKGARDEHLPVKSGNVNWRRVAKGLEGYEGRFVTEARTLVQGAQSMRNLKAFLEGSA
ncbi:sugar phosphate isomerase/epimerase family protein [Methanothrix harundinacea]|uniref:AP endonuclease, family 2 n=1 Tax=Methanothrix harundinacea (strain 6Ac) TaxID=1110509 RepID=G7WPA4_METH6|nr:sugar phosphate isomerase/epimerase family protein [Methanothrix harundinacea]AET64945.1 AP endonuclease, family 2 [Methanothrix harundinacea 6Ac]